MCLCNLHRYTIPSTIDMDAEWAKAAELYADEIKEWAALSSGIADETWPKP